MVWCDHSTDNRGYLNLLTGVSSLLLQDIKKGDKRREDAIMQRQCLSLIFFNPHLCMFVLCACVHICINQF